MTVKKALHATWLIDFYNRMLALGGKEIMWNSELCAGILIILLENIYSKHKKYNHQVCTIPRYTWGKLNYANKQNVKIKMANDQSYRWRELPLSVTK